MKVTQTKLPGVLVIEPDVFGDARGFFIETFSSKRYEEAVRQCSPQAGLKLPFVQDNISFSQKNVLRGLHFQNPHAQGKLVQVLIRRGFRRGGRYSRRLAQLSGNGLAKHCRRKITNRCISRRVSHTASAF